MHRFNESIYDPNCSFCGNAEEDIYHLFAVAPFARGVWSCLLNCPTSIDGNNLIQWFKTMFLSNNDDYTSMEKCLLAGLGGQKLIIGFSDNFYRILQKS